MSEIKHDLLASPSNPNGVFDAFVTRKVEKHIPNKVDRLTLAIADLRSYLVEVVNIEPEMAEVVAARAAYEIVNAVDGELSNNDIREASERGSKLSVDVSVDRAIEGILDQS